MPVRRSTDPRNLQYVWDSIRLANQQKQVAELSRLTKYIQKSSEGTLAQAELYIKQALLDGLIVDVKKIVQKGNNYGTEVESYRINVKPDDLQSPPDDGHDWYCIECHLAGDVTCCRKCFRVFHTECSTNARQKQPDLFPRKNHISNHEQSSYPAPVEGAEAPVAPEKPDVEVPKDETTAPTGDYIYDETLCSLCNLNELDSGSGLELEEFNYLLRFILMRIKSWVPDMLTNTLSTEEVYTLTEQRWRAEQLFYHHMDMSLVDLKIKNKEYNKFAQFQADVYTMLHNIAIFHGVESQEYGAAMYMIRDMKHDIAELQNCVDCYKHSNEKINNRWFCLPCRKPHELVWAKQKGYPYWPAKVIREMDTAIDVRFFSGKYERSVLPKNCIKPITTSISQLQIKRTAMFNKAVEELHLHQKLLENPSEVAKLQMAPSLAKRKSSSKPRKSSLQGSTHSERTPKSITKSRPSEAKDGEDGVRDAYEFIDDPPVVMGKDGALTPVVKRKSNGAPEGPSLPKMKRKLSVSPAKQEGKAKVSHDVIHISDVEDDRDTFQAMQENSNCELSDSGLEQVTSSTELEHEDIFTVREGTDSVMQKLDQPYSDAVEKMRRKLEHCKEKPQLIPIAMDCMQAETDRLTNEHNETLKRLFEAHNAQISETKKKQWCFNCEQDAIYHCCWNTAYCSPTCQQQHWQAEHKKVCRRKR